MSNLLELDIDDVSLQVIFDRYMELSYRKGDLSPAEIESVKSVFMAGAAGVLGIYDGIMQQLMEMEDAYDAECDLNGSDTHIAKQLDENMDAISIAMGDVFASLMGEVDKHLDEQETRLKHEETAGTTTDFDLENWTPDSKGN